MRKYLSGEEKQSDLVKLLWVIGLLFFLTIGLVAHAAMPKAESILLSAPNLHGKNFFTILINSPDPKEAPKNFRILSSAGDESLRASASGVLSKGQFEYLIAKLNSDAVPGTLGETKKIHVVDTSSHAHGFVNNMQVIWLDQAVLSELDDRASEDLESDLLAGLKRAKKLTLYTVPASSQEVDLNLSDVLKLGGQKIQVQADAAETEQQYLKTKRILYTRIPITGKDLAKIENKQIEQFTKLVRKIKKEEWLHFHNEEGASNLSQALLIVDVLRNASRTSLEDILSRQNALNTEVKLENISITPRLEQIYSYAKEQAPDFKKPFTNWHKNE